MCFLWGEKAIKITLKAYFLLSSWFMTLRNLATVVQSTIKPVTMSLDDSNKNSTLQKYNTSLDLYASDHINNNNKNHH